MEQPIRVIVDVTPTIKERVLVQYLADDLRPKEVSEKQGFSVKTIEAQIMVIKRKFGIRTVAGLVALFMRNGMIK